MTYISKYPNSMQCIPILVCIIFGMWLLLLVTVSHEVEYTRAVALGLRINHTRQQYLYTLIVINGILVTACMCVVLVANRICACSDILN